MVAARNEDTSCDDGVLRLSLEQLRIVCHPEEQFRSLSGGLGYVLRVAKCCDLTVGSLERLVGLVVVGLIVCARQLSYSQASVAKADLGRKLGAVEQRVCGVSDTRGVIVALVVVGKGSPL